jgi:uncharacterized peroxidase-related enzyme
MATKVTRKAGAAKRSPGKAKPVRAQPAKRGDVATRAKAGEAVPGTAPSRRPDRYPLADLGALPPDLRERILAVQEKAGFVPNVFLKLARRPAEFRAFFAYHDALMLGEGPLSKAEREMIVVATSTLNDCLYCVVAHGAILRIYQKDPLIADQVAVNYRKAPISPRQRAMLDFACKVATDSGGLDEEDYARLQQHGFDSEAAWDIAAIAAFSALSNRLANATGMMPNEAFYRMGR